MVTSARVHKALNTICLSRDLESLMLRTRRAARALTRADGVAFILRAGQTCYYADEEAIAPLWKGQRFPLDACVSGWAMRNRQSVLIPDIYADARVPTDAYRPTFVKSMAMVPVRKADPIAAIGAYWQHQHAPTDDHLRVLELLAEGVGVALTNTQHWLRFLDSLPPMRDTA